MHNLRRFYYQNKEKIWKVVLIVAALLGLIYFLNYTTVERSKQNNSNQVIESQSYSDEENKTYISDKSAITGENITSEDAQKINNTVSKFLQYCKNENYEEAYNMISSDCKEKKYPTVDKFTEKYIKTKFGKDKVYEIEEWIGNTYRVSISEDILATGNVGNTKKIVEYITIVKENSENKLNINNYVGQKDIGKEITKNNVRITVIKKDIYMDYEIYDFKVENLSSKTIKLDAFEKTSSMYLEDTKGNQYNAYSHEIFEDELVILPKRTFEISIKFSNAYASNRTIETIVFSNLILDYDEYENEPKSEDLSEFVINL